MIMHVATKSRIRHHGVRLSKHRGTVRAEPVAIERARIEAARQLLIDLSTSDTGCALAARSLTPGAGLSLVAEQQCLPGDVLLKVPMAAVLKTEDDHAVRSARTACPEI
jgi:hypothetical protein